MIRTRRSITIDRPAEEVLAYLSHVENEMAWRSDLLEVRRTTPGNDGPGSRYRERLRWLDHEADVTVEVTAVRSAGRVSFMFDGGVQGLAEYAVSGEAGKTRVRIVEELQLIGPLADAEDDIREAVRAYGRRDVEHLKNILEHRSVPRT